MVAASARRGPHPAGCDVPAAPVRRSGSGRSARRPSDGGPRRWEFDVLAALRRSDPPHEYSKSLHSSSSPRTAAAVAMTHRLGCSAERRARASSSIRTPTDHRSIGRPSHRRAARPEASMPPHDRAFVRREEAEFSDPRPRRPRRSGPPPAAAGPRQPRSRSGPVTRMTATRRSITCRRSRWQHPPRGPRPAVPDASSAMPSTAGGSICGCAYCGHIGCCDSSPAKHASAHARETGHRVIQSFEPGESWFLGLRRGGYVDGPDLAPPVSHPESQPRRGRRAACARGLAPDRRLVAAGGPRHFGYRPVT